MKPTVAAALARMDARAVRPEAQPITWRRWGSRHRSGCEHCGAKRGMLVYTVRPERRDPMVRPDGTVFQQAIRFSWIGQRCIDTATCDARFTKARAARSRRSGTIRWAQSRFESPDIDLPKGSCHWCGQPIVLAEGVSYRHAARQRHRGDDKEVGDRNCDREYGRTYAFSGRWLVIYRGDPCCVWCGEAEVWVEDVLHPDGGWWRQGEWEADHIDPLEDGGAHCATNIARCCCRCHKEKTARENAARRANRAVDKAQPAA